MPKYWAHYSGNFAEQSDDVHEQFGFYPVVFPDYNPQLQTRGEIYWDEVRQVFTYPVTNKVFDLEELKQQHRDMMPEVIREISQLASDIKNIYDPLRDKPQNIPPEFKQLVAMILPLHQRGKAEIEALSTVEEALAYVVRGPQVEGFITQLKTFL